MRPVPLAFAPSGTAKPCACGHTKEQHHKKRRGTVATNCWLCRCALYTHNTEGETAA